MHVSLVLMYDTFIEDSHIFIPLKVMNVTGINIHSDTDRMLSYFIIY
jgi:hypothetical protein